MWLPAWGSRRRALTGQEGGGRCDSSLRVPELKLAACEPPTGGGIAVSGLRSFLLAWQNGKQAKEEQVAFAWDILARQGQRLVN